MPALPCQCHSLESLSTSYWRCVRVNPVECDFSAHILKSENTSLIRGETSNHSFPKPSLVVVNLLRPERPSRMQSRRPANCSLSTVPHMLHIVLSGFSVPPRALGYQPLAGRLK
jgi:hypothetical protein